jgi:protein phosphatase
MKAVQYSHQGKRDNQEDAYGFENDKFFVVCDGVGGHEKGEVASNFVVDYVKSHFTELDVVNKISLQELIVSAQLEINRELVETPEANGMGTTFAGVFRGDDAFYIVHLGDSRIYWVKPRSEQIWHTWDHSMVGNLMQMGEITREEGRFHPNGNRISKAIIANADGKTSKPDISKVTQVDAGDLFLICSDGVTEAWSEYELVEVLCDSQKTVEQKLASIQERCAEQSKDNNTAILLEVDTQLALNGADNEEISWLTLDFFRSDYEAYHNPQTVEIEAEITAEEPIELELVHESQTEHIPLPPVIDQSNDSKKKVFMAIVLIIVALIAAFFIKKMNNGAETDGDGLLILAKENKLYGFQNSNKEYV